MCGFVPGVRVSYFNLPAVFCCEKDVSVAENEALESAADPTADACIENQIHTNHNTTTGFNNHE